MLWYLAHPYSGDEEANFERVNELAAELFKWGVKLYSPVSHSHPIHQHLDEMTKDEEHAFWMEVDLEFMQRCDGLLLAQGWEESRGCREEKEYFTQMDKPVIVLNSFQLHVFHEISKGEEYACPSCVLFPLCTQFCEHPREGYK